MLAMHAQMDRTRAVRMLDALQVQSAQHMRQHDFSTFVNRLIDRCRASVSEAIEQVTWNGSLMRSARALKAKAMERWGSGVAA